MLEKKEQQQQQSQPPSDGVTVLKEGILYKRGEYIRNWRQRYFVLKSNGDFWGYKSKSDYQHAHHPMNNFNVKNCSIYEHNEPKPFTFSLKGLHMTAVAVRNFYADTAEERKSWLAAIESVKSKDKNVPMDEDDDDHPDNSLAKSSSGSTGQQVNKVSFEDFVFVKVLGKGNFGKVVLCRMKLNKKLYALKILKKDVIIKKKEVAHVFTERNVLQKSNHPFLLNLVCSFSTPERICFVTEFVNGGELYVHLINDKFFTEARSKFYAAEIVCALGYLHNLGIIYRDLKLENVLLDRDGHIRIADFGVCKENIYFGDVTATFCGTPEYLAPEVIMDDDYCRSVDWWSLGVLTFEMMTGTLPFYNDDQRVMFELILYKEVQFPSRLSPQARSLLLGLLTKAPSDRLGAGPADAEDVKKHQFFADINWVDLEEKKVVTPFKPELSSDSDTRYFDPDLANESPDLTPSIAESASDESIFKRFSFSTPPPVTLTK